MVGTNFPIEYNPKLKDIYVGNLNTQISTTYDTDRVEYSNRVKLETKFYNAFKNTMRNIILADPNYNKLHELCTNPPFTLTYVKQLSQVNQLLKNIGKKSKSIVFVDYSKT